MSTEIYLRCLDHDPPLCSDEVGVRLTDLPRIREDIANRELWTALARAEACVDRGDYFKTNTASFLVEHPKCRIGIRDEYGNDHPITEGDE